MPIIDYGYAGYFGKRQPVDNSSEFYLLTLEGIATTFHHSPKLAYIFDSTEPIVQATI